MLFHFPLISQSLGYKSSAGPLLRHLLGAKLFYVFLVLTRCSGFHTEMSLKQF